VRKNVLVARRVCVGVVQNCILILTFVALAFPGILRAGQNTDPKLAPQNVPTGPRIWLAERQALHVQHAGATAGDQAVAQSVTAGSAVPLTLAKGDFDGDGYEDLVVGYSTPAGGAIVLHRGNINAFAPQAEASFQAIGRGEFPSPFLTQATVFKVPVRPDFIAAGDFTGFGHLDLVIAALGGTSVYVLPGVGGGRFGAPQQFQLTGSVVTTLAAKNLGIGTSSFSNVLVGLSSLTHVHSLLILGGSEVGLTAVATFPLSGAASNINFGDFGDAHPDALFVAGSNLVLLHSASMRLEPISVPVSAVSLALGTFIYDRNPQLQIAVLDSTGSVQIVVHNEFDPHVRSQEELKALHTPGKLRSEADPAVPARVLPVNGWKIVETVPGLAHVDGSQPPVMFATRISDHGADDVALISPATAQLHIIAHPDNAFGAATFLPAQVSSRPYRGSPTAAISARVNIDGRPGIIALHAGEITPAVMMPLPDPTFFVNRSDDPVVPVSSPGVPNTAGFCNNVSSADTSSPCSLREAIVKANATAGTDTIMVPAGTFTLALARNAADHHTSLQGTLEVQDSVNIIGAGQNSTIVQGGTSLATSVDKVISFNQDIDSFSNATVSVSNLTIQNGNNRGDCCVTQDGFGGAFDFDTGNPGTATLTMTNVTIQNNAVSNGQGGGFTMFNTKNGTGFATLTNVIVQNNDATAVNDAHATCCGDGGGGVIDARSKIVMSNVQVLTNHTHSLGGVNPTGGGLFFSGQHTQPQSHISGGSISNNTATGIGGGINNEATLLIDGGTIISGNSSGNAGPAADNQGAGGIANQSSDGLTLSKVTITGNSTAGNGGGIFNGDTGTGIGPVSIQFSRIAGNTSSFNTAGNNFYNARATSAGATGNQVNATNNWWASNVPSSSIINNGGAAVSSCPANSVNEFCFDPFIVLTHTANPVKIRINQSATLTSDMSKDNHGNGAALVGNLDLIVGLPITFNNPILGTIPQAQPETLNSGAQATATFNAGGTSGNGSADATVDQQTVTANINILEPLQISKSFSPTTVAVGASSTLTFNVNNPNTIAVDGSFTDTLPAGLVVAVVPGATNTCGGTVTATAGASSISFSNATLPIGGCAITAKVVGSTDGVFNNTVTIDSTAAGTGAQSTSSASLTVIAPPTISKVFGAATIPLNGSTGLTFTLTNPNANSTLTGTAFTDSLPSGLVVATPTNLNSTCSGTAAAVSGSSSASVSGASLAPGANCTISLNVTGTTAGVKNNSVTVTSTNGGTGNISNASLTVITPPVIIKAFGAANIPLNGSTTLSFTIQNNNTTTTLTGAGFIDTFPAGLVVSTPNGLTGTCGGGTIASVAGAGSVSLSGASLAASSSCTFSVNVTGTTAGTKNNTTGNVTSTEGGTGGTASASINVIAPPSIAKVFNPLSIALNSTTSLTFTVTNPATNAVALTGVAFTDTLPTGLTVANASATVCGGTLTTTAPTGIALTGATIAVNSQCQFSVTVTGAASGQFTNTTGNVTSTNGGTGNTATANLTVATPPTITKAFGAASVPLNGTTSLTFSIANPNAVIVLTGVAFTDTFPAGTVVATPSNLNSTCGGTATAVGGSGQVNLAAGTLASTASCTISLNVQGTTGGIKNNSVQVTSTEGGTGNTSNASLTVVGAPVIIKAFGVASILLNGSTSLTFTIQNNNTTTALTGTGFTDNLPAGLVVSTPNGLTGTCGAGTITATQATNVISLTGATIAASTSCTFVVNVTGTTAGLKNNTTGVVTSTEGGTGGTASASVTVVAPLSIAKAFGAANLPLNGTTSLTFTITNPAANTVAETGVAFTDTLPAGIVVATPNGLTNTCGGTGTAVAGSGSISLTGGTVATSSTCTLTANVTGTASGQFTNTTGAVTSTNGGTGNTGTANLSVATPPTIVKAFGAASISVNGSTSLTFTIANPAANTISLTGIAFTDNLPAGLVVATPSALTSTCGGTATATAGSGVVTLSGSTLAPNTSCAISTNVTATTGGVKNNSVQVTATESGVGNTSNASITVVAPPVIVKTFAVASIPLNGSTSLTFTIQNNNATSALNGVGFTDTLPVGLAIATPNGQSGTCGTGTITAAAGTNVISLSGATLAAGTSCTFSVNVTGLAAGTQNNTTGNVTSAQGGIGGTASASISVVAPPSISKAFTPAGISPNGISGLSFTITNPAANMVTLTGVVFTDVLPAGITIATPNGLTGSCGGTTTATAGFGTVTLSGASIAASGSCTLSVNVTGSTAGNFTNITGNVTSTNGGTGNAATATLTVATAPSIAKSFGATSLGLSGSTSLTFTITNANSTLAMTGVTFADALPAGLVVATPNGLAGACGTGTVSAPAGAQSVSLAGGTVAASGSCSFSINVTATSPGTKVNTTGSVSAANAGTGNTATAAINVLAPDLTISKSHTGNFFQGQTAATYTATINNVGHGPTGGTVTVIEAPPVGLTVTSLAGIGWSCNIGTFSCTRSDALASGASYPAISVAVSVAATATATVTNSISVSGGGELNLANDTATDAATVTAPPDFTLAASPVTITIRAGAVAMYGLTLTSVNNNFTGAIALSATGLPGKATLNFTPSSVTPGANPATSTLTVFTTAGDPFLAKNSGSKRGPLFAILLPLWGCVLSGIGLRKRAWRQGKVGFFLLAVWFTCCGFLLNGCASAQNLRNLGTPPGSYSITVTGASGATQHANTVTLVVEP
jgi:uncharacterized repeat protein (TIGR01451 family)